MPAAFAALAFLLCSTSSAAPATPRALVSVHHGYASYHHWRSATGLGSVRYGWLADRHTTSMPRRWQIATAWWARARAAHAHYAATIAIVNRWPWPQLRVCETGGNWHWWQPSYEGAYGFAHSTWQAYRGSFPSTAPAASPLEQTLVAMRVLAAAGPGAWPACSIRIGMR